MSVQVLSPIVAESGQIPAQTVSDSTEMRRFVYKVNFVPRMPQANVKVENRYTSSGDYFLVATNEYDFVDFVKPPSKSFPFVRVHISPPFRVMLNEEQMKKIESISTEIFHCLALQSAYSVLTKAGFSLLPAMEYKNMNPWIATMKWVECEMNSCSLYKMYTDSCWQQDKTNQGRKLREFFHTKGDFVDRFLRFVMDIKVPIEQFLENTPECTSIEIGKQELIALYTALKLQSRITGRICRRCYLNQMSLSGKMSVSMHVMNVIAFDKTPKDLWSEAKNITFQERYTHLTKQEIDPEAPMLELLYVRRDENIDDIYQELIQFPQAYSNAHMRFIEILERKPGEVLEIVKKILQRIPESYEPPIPEAGISYAPLEIENWIDLPRIAGISIHFLNRLIDQLKPVSVGKGLASDLVRSCAESLYKQTGFKFKDLKNLRSALTDATYRFRQTLFMHEYQRLEFLGDGVLDICVTFPMFNYNPDATEGEMTFLKHAMVSNDTFAKLAKRMGLDQFVITNTMENYTEKRKNLADVLESVFGAMYLDSSQIECCRVYQVLVQQHPDVFFDCVSKFRCGRSTVQRTIDMPESDYCRVLRPPTPVGSWHVSVEDIRDTIGIEISRRELPVFVVALTHPSAQAGYDYNRLEFIGDIIVKMGLEVALHQSFANASESGLSICASYYKSNDVLGRLSVKLGLAKIALLGDKSEILKDTIEDLSADNAAIDKVHGDLFEAITAAIVVCFGLKRGLDFVIENVIGDRFTNRADDPKVDPKTACSNLLVKELHSAPPVYDIWNYNDTFYAYVSILGVQLPFIGESSDRTKAMMHVSRQILDAIENEPCFLPEILKQAEAVKESV